MKILSASQVRRADAHTIENEPIASIDLMERASLAFVKWFISQFDRGHRVAVVCGTGNNGGDGLAIARFLEDRKYEVHAFTIGYHEKASADFKINHDRVSDSLAKNISTERDIPNFEVYDVVIDAIFGSGLTRPVEGLHAQVIEQINLIISPVVSVDIPSGLFCDKQNEGGAIIESDWVISFQLPKLAFFLPQNARVIKNWQVVEIGLDQRFIAEEKTNYSYQKKEKVAKLLKPRERFSHKGTYGHAFLVCGSKGKIGAAVLAARACLRAGAGLVTTHLPICGCEIMQAALPEVMVSLDESSECVSSISIDKKYAAIGIGPGLGTSLESKKALCELLERAEAPLVIDADALNIISQNPDLLQKIPAGSVLTPHPKEFQRLVGNWANDYEKLEVLADFAKKHRINVVLKGAYTAISDDNGDITFNSTGNPGMATAGSGDVLTGIITGLVACGYASNNATKLGVLLHGLAGDLAAADLCMESLIASDIIEYLPKAFKKLTQIQ